MRVLGLRALAGLCTTAVVLTMAACTVHIGGTSTPTSTSVLSTSSTIGAPAVRQAGAESPDPRWGHSAAYDPAAQKMVVFGGAGADFRYFNDTWIYDPLTVTWTAANVSPCPNSRQAASMAYDPATRRFVLFGGENGTGVLSDTWVYDLASDTWSRLQLDERPPARCSHSMVFDAATGDIILFGGIDWDMRAFADTWAFDPATDTWAEIETKHTPPARDSFVMESLGSSGTIVLFGGEIWSGGPDPIPTALDDTWIYDTATQDWSEVETQVSPGARDSAAFVWEASSGTVLLFGGEVFATGVSFGDMWAFDPRAGRWTTMEIDGLPPARDCHSMVDTGTSAGVILFGGSQNIDQVLFNDVWSYHATEGRWEPLIEGSSLPVS